MAATDVDVLVIGAGLSGIGAAAQLTMRCPDRTFAVIERRQAIGGTWDLFRYPGIRCDSDMYTLGYSFRPWPHDDVITDGESVRTYIQDTATEYGIDEHIHFGHRVTSASWSTADACWTVTTIREQDGQEVAFTANFVIACAGYYSYDQAYVPDLPGLEDFEGDVIHPQFWDEDYDYSGKRVLIVGSGATAVTLVPAMAEDAAHVTMLQRSPTYMLTLPQEDVTSKALKWVLPDDVVSNLTRTRNTALQMGLYRISQWQPDLVRNVLLSSVRAQLHGEVDMRHFTPSYDPWDERLCVVPNGDLFRSLRSGKATVVTDQIDRFTANGVELASGATVEADLVITATGLQLQLMGDVQIDVDGLPVKPTERLTYKGSMLADVPNLSMVFGYVNVSWTRKADMVSEYVCRLLNRMSEQGMRQVTPRHSEGFATDEPFIEMKSGYVLRNAHLFPRQGRRRTPWRTSQNVFVDLLRIRLMPIGDRFLEFSNPVRNGGRNGGRDGSRARRSGALDRIPGVRELRALVS